MNLLCVLWMFVCYFTASRADYIDSTTYGNYEYALYDRGNDVLFFYGASFKCNTWKTGGVLAMPKSDIINDELYFLSHYTSSWIGVTDGQHEGNWVYVDGTSLVYSRWTSNEPNDDKGEDCAEFIGSYHGEWNDKDCYEQRAYLCQFPLSCTQTYDYSDFTFYENQKNFEAAEEMCNSVGARLVQIENNEQKDELLEKLKAKHNFLDLTKDTRYWIRDNSDGNCLVLGADGFEKVDCSEANFSGICETARPNTVTVSDEHPYIIESEERQINCVASGYPVPEVRWYKDDELVFNQVTGRASSTLQITNASEADAGRYACVATNTINERQMSSKGVSYVSVSQRQD